MALVEINDLTIGFRGPPLLDGVDCRIDRGQRIGLLGRNGAGKTTLMKVLAGKLAPDHGTIRCDKGIKTAILSQEVPSHLTGTISEIVAGGLAGEHAGVEHHEAAWQGTQKVDKLLSKINLDGDTLVEGLSSGMKRRVLLARTLVTEPDLLLLDEPTNHLDIEAISWLENLLLGWPTTLLFVTHDRAFLRNLATRILEIDRGRIFDWSCDYETFLQRKEAALAAEEKQNALFDKRLAEEEAWIRQGIKARRTRNEGRVRALKQMRVERSQRRERIGSSKLQIQTGQKSGALVAKVEDISFAYDANRIVANFSTAIMRGDKIGFIGPNGAGKTTLLKLLLGKLSPQSGHVRLGTNLDIAYFDQLRDQLDGELTVQENVGDGSDNVNINGRSKHVLGYLQDFLFTPERARTQVRFLSGGEKNRILLAKLFAKPANVLVLDEPTNDLDTETLEMLEERLVDYAGTLLLVSHDREFLNNVVTSSIVFEPDGVNEYVGGYDDWVRQRDAKRTLTESGDSGNKSSGGKEQAKVALKPADKKRKLSYNEQRELKSLPATIEKLEQQIEERTQAMSDPEYFKQSADKIASDQKAMSDWNEQLADAYQRWEVLEAME